MTTRIYDGTDILKLYLTRLLKELHWYPGREGPLSLLKYLLNSPVKEEAKLRQRSVSQNKEDITLI